MSHVLEHLSNPHKVMEELYRISKPNALIKIMTPYFTHVSAYSWSHIRFFK